MNHKLGELLVNTESAWDYNDEVLILRRIIWRIWDTLTEEQKAAAWAALYREIAIAKNWSERE